MVRTGLREEPVVPQGGEGGGAALQSGGEIALTRPPSHPLAGPQERGGAAHTAGATARPRLAVMREVVRGVPVRVVQCLDVDGRGDVAGEVLGPGRDGGYEVRERVAGEEPGHSSHHRSGTDQVSWRYGVVRPVPGRRPQRTELNPGQDTAQD